MKRSSRRLKANSAAGITLFGAALALAGCSATNPITIASPYAAADGTNGQITDPATGSVVDLRNFLVVGSEKGKPGVLVGAIANEGTQPVTVNLTVSATAADGTSSKLAVGSVTAKPSVLTFVGPGGTPVQIGELPSAPGVVLSLVASTSAGGQQLTIPVVAAKDQYASITPDPNAATAIPSPSAS